jgi:hypothetical protein
MRKVFFAILGLCMIGALCPRPTAANPVNSIDQFNKGYGSCKNSVFRIFEERIKGPQRNFSPNDINVEINPLLEQRLLSNMQSTEQAISSAGTSYVWSVPSKNARGYCDISPGGIPKVTMINPL